MSTVHTSPFCFRPSEGLNGSRVKSSNFLSASSHVAGKLFVAFPEFGDGKRAETHRWRGPCDKGLDFPARTCWRTLSSRAAPAPSAEKSPSISASQAAKSRSATQVASCACSSWGRASMARCISGRVIFSILALPCKACAPDPHCVRNWTPLTTEPTHHNPSIVGPGRPYFFGNICRWISSITP